jgi:hypothetical protein
MYPKYMVKDPSSFSIHPSYAGDTLWPLEYVNLVWAPAGWNNRSAAKGASNSRPLLHQRAPNGIIADSLT